MGEVAFDFSGRVAAVTGAATGIGRATALAFARAGARVFALDIDEQGGVDVGRQNVHFLRCDVTSTDDVNVAFERVQAGCGRLDILVNNAGGFGTQQVVTDIESEEWQRIVDLNLTSVFTACRRAIPLLRTSAGGRIINLGSLAGQAASHRTSPAYAAAKAGVHSLTRVLASELAADGVTVNAIAPSAVMTERIEHLRTEAEHQGVVSAIPVGRYQRPEEVAEWVLFLASRAGAFMTGQTISVNGGRYMAQ